MSLHCGSDVAMEKQLRANLPQYLGFEEIDQACLKEKL